MEWNADQTAAAARHATQRPSIRPSARPSVCPFVRRATLALGCFDAPHAHTRASHHFTLAPLLFLFRPLLRHIFLSSARQPSTMSSSSTGPSPSPSSSSSSPSTRTHAASLLPVDAHSPALLALVAVPVDTQILRQFPATPPHRTRLDFTHSSSVQNEWPPSLSDLSNPTTTASSLLPPPRPLQQLSP
jgi:hypothetical protein